MSLARDGRSWGTASGCDGGFVAISGGKNIVLVCRGCLSVLKTYYVDGSWHVLVLSVVLLNREASVSAVLRSLFVRLLK